MLGTIILQVRQKRVHNTTQL